MEKAKLCFGLQHQEKFELQVRFYVDSTHPIVGDSKQIFREDKMTTRLMGCFVTIRGREWLQTVLSPVIKEMSGSYEVITAMFMYLLTPLG